MKLVREEINFKYPVEAESLDPWTNLYTSIRYAIMKTDMYKRLESAEWRKKQEKQQQDIYALKNTLIDILNENLLEEKNKSVTVMIPVKYNDVISRTLLLPQLKEFDGDIRYIDPDLQRIFKYPTMVVFRRKCL